jgi:hypothetical protein
MLFRANDSKNAHEHPNTDYAASNEPASKSPLVLRLVSKFLNDMFVLTTVKHKKVQWHCHDGSGRDRLHIRKRTEYAFSHATFDNLD